MCGIAETTLDMATVLKKKAKENEKQMKLATMTKRIDRMIEAVKHLTTEKEEMAGILECPVEQQRIMKRLANNRFAALSEEEDEEHGGRPTMTDMCATNRHAAIKYDDVLAKGTRLNNDDKMSTGTTHSIEQ